MLVYHKIESVYKRDPAKKHKNFIEGEWSRPEFACLANAIWEWTEKVDGTNMRVEYSRDGLGFGGRTAEAQIPAFLLKRMHQLFPIEKMMNVFGPRDDLAEKPTITLFGEGYGAKIQKGGENYLPDRCDFVLFDVAFSGRYASREAVNSIAASLGVDAVPVVGRGTLTEAIEYTRAGFNSQWGDFQAEGLIMRPSVEIMSASGSRIITKVKCRDFQ